MQRSTRLQTESTRHLFVIQLGFASMEHVRALTDFEKTYLPVGKKTLHTRALVALFHL